jgi:hypothetical protein
VSGFAAGKKIDIFPRKAWVESHVMYVGTYPAIPACFGQVDEVTIALVDLFEFELEVSKFVIGEIALSCDQCCSRFFSSIAGMRMDSLALYQPLHLHSMETAVLQLARMTAFQNVSYAMSREVRSSRYLL